ncbi:UDP-N-acetylglucosamine transferase subunit ALG13 [Colletotrichum higginsianum IMI 349063]|uniref:UDP-N-acetylglucosamine transferase subunit ALG13 n=2 Tax=Colletotrichum higginsianum TaxID=80884 RepID=A0A1B7XTI8_COLHI|nr:UDP-N-acetylglucosamine transferase subunit ALG13 [Colletotrichum higginsianum IMI 349063]OBR03070.1 UDP-N-acetylglucosamine transferase subunit ALG13 [Colletotrichum higginsianum IMI 349063]
MATPTRIPRHPANNTFCSHKSLPVPFQTRLLKDASTPEQLQSLLPASYRTGPDGADLAPPGLDNLAFLEAELGQGRLAKLSARLWMAGRPIPPRALHYQRLLGREIVVAEQMDLHLVWASGRIHVKPLPPFLLEPTFWSDHLSCRGGYGCSRSTDPLCRHRMLWKCSLGFLFSYAGLICHQSDFFIAKEMHLIPEAVEWSDWRLFVSQLGTEHIYNDIDRRFIYGELRLSRLNKLQYLESGLAFRGYMPHWNRYGDFFHDHFAWLASATVYIAIVLTAMQVGLATTSLAENDAFQSASYGFTIFSIVRPVFATVLILLLFCCIFLSK